MKGISEDCSEEYFTALFRVCHQTVKGMTDIHIQENAQGSPLAHDDDDSKVTDTHDVQKHTNCVRNPSHTACLMTVGDNKGVVRIAAFPYTTSASSPQTHAPTQRIDSAQKDTENISRAEEKHENRACALVAEQHVHAYVASLTYACKKIRGELCYNRRVLTCGGWGDAAVYQWEYEPGPMYTDADLFRGATKIQAVFRGQKVM